MEKTKSAVYLSEHVILSLKYYGFSFLLAAIILAVVPLFLNYIFLYYVGGILFLGSVLAPTVIKWMPKEKISPQGKAVLISGCDTGFGHMLAQQLDDLGLHVFAGCLFPEGDGATKLRKSGSNRLHVIGLDVTQNSSVMEAVGYVKQNLKDNVLWAVVNNAGINAGGEIHWTDLETIKSVFEVNTFGVVRLTKAFLPQLKESQGRVVTVCSIAGRYPCALLVPYSMSKAAAIGFCEGLRLEMYKWNIPVISIEPWTHRTPIMNADGIAKNFRDTWESAPKDVKDMYSSKYIDAFITNAIEFLTTVPTYNPREVVSVLEEAVMALYPEFSYTPGGFRIKFGYWFYERLPKPLADMLAFEFAIKRFAN